MNSTHTPGPWVTQGATGIYKMGEGGGAIAIVAEPECRFTSDIEKVSVQSKRWDEAMANASLLAAAPELLDALEAVACDLSVELNERGITGEKWHSLVDARAAIAKAKGEV